MHVRTDLTQFAYVTHVIETRVANLNAVSTKGLRIP